MAKHFIIWEDGVEDDIEVYNSEPVIVVHAARGDLEKLATLDEANLPGIYVLYSDNMRYVGQASKSVYNRISQHDKKKPWWSHLVIIAREDGRLDKSQLDFMENRLIKECIRADLTMDNNTEGNSSHIETYQKGKAQQVLITGMRILEENGGVKLFKRVRERREIASTSITTTTLVERGSLALSPGSGVEVVGARVPSIVRGVESGLPTTPSIDQPDELEQGDVVQGEVSHMESAPRKIKRTHRPPGIWMIEVEGRIWENKTLKFAYLACMQDLLNENPGLKELLLNYSRERGNSLFLAEVPVGKEKIYATLGEGISLYHTLSSDRCISSLTAAVNLLGKSVEVEKIPLAAPDELTPPSVDVALDGVNNAAEYLS